MTPTSNIGLGGGSALNSGEDGSSNPGGMNGGKGGASTGGGGGSTGHPIAQSGSGGSGIVIVRYKIGSIASQKATGGEVSFYGGKTIHTFVGSGTFAVPSEITDVDYVIIGGGGGGSGRDGSYSRWWRWCWWLYS